MNAPIPSSTFKPGKWLEIHPRLGISLMDHLFNRLDGFYPNKWKAQFRSEQAIANWRESWAEAFEEEGITTAMISEGIRATRRKYEWPPSITEFMNVCKPPIDVDAAIYEAIDQMRARQHGKDRWSDPAIFWAAATVGEYDMISQTFSQLKPRFEAALKKVLQGEVLPVPVRVSTLAAPGAAESTREYGRQRLDALNASATFKNMSKGGNIRWAEKIVEQQRQTAKVPLHRLGIAREAIFNVTGRRP